MFRFVVLAVIFGVCVGQFGTTHDAPIIPNADNIPPGRYRHSCEGCKVDGEYVVCEGCKNADGQWVVAKALISSCQSFMNMDGTLVCSRSVQDNEVDIPDGEYKQSCGGCFVFMPEDEPGKKYLGCLECMDSKGEMHLNELDITEPCDAIVNMEGELICRRYTKDEL